MMDLDGVAYKSISDGAHEKRPHERWTKIEGRLVVDDRISAKVFGEERGVFGREDCVRVR